MLLSVLQRDLMASWAPYMPSLPTYLTGLWPRPSAILEIAIDSERNILYTRSQNSSIQACTGLLHGALNLHYGMFIEKLLKSLSCM